VSVQEAPPRAERHTGSTCPTCGAQAEPGQLICLECGSRIALGYRRPPSWRVPVAILAVVLALAAAGAIIGLNAIDDDAKKEVAATPTRSTSSAKSKKQSGTKTKKKSTTKKTEEPKATAGADGIQSWPKGRTGFTVVILSAEDRATARKFASSVIDSGSDAGVLRSNDYKSLPRGFYVVFSGVYSKRAQAEKAAAKLGSRYSGAFPQLVKK
jgi:septal ring-binding cell division protein DamX